MPLFSRLARRRKTPAIGLEVLRAEARDVPTASLLTSPPLGRKFSARERGMYRRRPRRRLWKRAEPAPAPRQRRDRIPPSEARRRKIPATGLEVLRAVARDVPTASSPSVREAGGARACAASAARPNSAERSEAAEKGSRREPPQPRRGCQESSHQGKR